jgi:hypothetical protein
MAQDTTETGILVTPHSSPVTRAASLTGPELLRRVLLGLVTALIVARPMVPGEDPGRLIPTTGVAGQVLAVLWLVVGLGWAAWWAWTWREQWYAGWLEVGLLGLVGLVGVSAAAAAHYQHPAWLIFSEWVVLLLAFSMVRQLAMAPADQRALVAVILATGVTLSVYAVYQQVVEIPHESSLSGEAVDKRIQESIEPYYPLEDQRPGISIRSEVSATFTSAHTFAGYLTLLLPVLVGAAAVCWRRRRAWSAHSIGVGGLIVLMTVALSLTQDVMALVALFLVGALAVVLGWRRTGAGARGWLVTGLVLLWLVALVSTLVTFMRFKHDGRSLFDWVPSLRAPFESWGPTWSLIKDHFWLGVGPGNFGRVYPRYLSSAALAPLAEPPNFALEIWATCGPLALLALLFVIAVFFRKAWTVVRDQPARPSKRGEPVDEQTPIPDSPRRTYWECYLGGVAGLILAFVLRAEGVAQSQLIQAGLVAAGQSAVWFMTYALLEGVPWSAAALVRAIAAGVAALLLYLTVSAGIGFPSLMLPVLVLAALALNALAPQPVSWLRRNWLAFLLPFPVLIACAVTYVMLIFYPVVSCASILRDVYRHAQVWRLRREPQLQEALATDGRDMGKRLDDTEPANRYLEQRIVGPLARAVREDPFDAWPRILLAQWYGKQCELFYRVWDQADPREPDFNERMYDTVRQKAMNLGSRALETRKAEGPARIAQRLDPDGPDGYRTEARVRQLFGQVFQTLEKQDPAESKVRKARGLPGFGDRSREEYRDAIEALNQLKQRDPTDVQTAYLLAEIYLQAGELGKCRRAGQDALRLDEQAVDPWRQLTDRQREQIRTWLNLPSGS